MKLKRSNTDLSFSDRKSTLSFHKEKKMKRKDYHQYYTNVTYRTCPDCLAWHGRISTDPKRFPDRDDGCARRVLAFSRKELAYHQEKERGT